MCVAIVDMQMCVTLKLVSNSDKYLINKTQVESVQLGKS